MATRVITKVLAGVKSVTVDKGKWNIAHNKGCTIFQIDARVAKQTQKFSLIVKTSNEGKKQYYFYKKHYNAKLCHGTLVITYTKKMAVS